MFLPIPLWVVFRLRSLKHFNVRPTESSELGNNIVKLE
jgi:hypothetical protein